MMNTEPNVEELRKFKRSFVETLVADGCPPGVAEQAVDLAYHAVNESERRLVEIAKSAGDIETSLVVMTVAAKMLRGLAATVEDMLLRQCASSDRVAADCEALLEALAGGEKDPVLEMLKARGVVVDVEKHGVILHGGSDPEGCDCESCAFARRVAAMPGVTKHDLDGVTAYVMPLELAQKLDMERSGVTLQ